MPAYELELVSNVKESETKEQEVLALMKKMQKLNVELIQLRLDGNEKSMY